VVDYNGMTFHIRGPRESGLFSGWEGIQPKYEARTSHQPRSMFVQGQRIEALPLGTMKEYGERALAINQ
jgi:hypothetical protein